MKKVLAVVMVALLVATVFVGCNKPVDSSEVSKPEASQSEMSESSASEPEASEPEASEPEASEPEASEPEASEPEVSEPEASEPEASEPEEKNYILYDWTKADTTSPALPRLGKCWSGLACGSSEFDAKTGSWKITATKELAGMQGAYSIIDLIPAVDMTTYEYVVVCYKTDLGEFDVLRLGRFGNVWADTVLPASSEFTTKIIKTADFDINPTNQNWEVIGFTVCNESSAEDTTAIGASFYVKYIAFFETKAEAEAFSIEG